MQWWGEMSQSKTLITCHRLCWHSTQHPWSLWAVLSTEVLTYIIENYVVIYIQSFQVVCSRVVCYWLFIMYQRMLTGKDICALVYTWIFKRDGSSINLWWPLNWGCLTIVSKLKAVQMPIDCEQTYFIQMLLSSMIYQSVEIAYANVLLLCVNIG